MKWSWKLGRFAGIDAYVHASFLLLVGWAAWAAYQGAGTGLAALLGVVFLVGVFASVLLHEFGHALMARRYGIRTRRIVLWPMGGVAQLEGDPRTPKQELHIALAGPAVNFALAGGLWLFTSLAGLPSYGLLASLMVANLTLGLFNLVPAFPMDGGRVLRAFLATRLGGGRATDIAVKVGKFAAVAFVIAGLFGNPMLMLVGAFVWFAAGAEGGRNPYATQRVDAPWWAWSRPRQHDPYRGASPPPPQRDLFSVPQRVIVFIQRR